MQSRSPLVARQREWLSDLHTRGLLKDIALAAELTDLGQSTERSTIGKYRNGDRQAPMALFFAVLRHLDTPARIVALDLVAREYGLRVVVEADAGIATADVRDQLLDVQGRLGELSTALRTASSDGTLTDEELADLHGRADALARDATQLREQLKPRRARRVRS